VKSEPWLRGVIPGVSPVTGHLLRSAEHIREDVADALAPLTTEQVWATPHGGTSAGFHAKHLAGSTQRLCTYLEGGQLSVAQLAEIPAEGTGTESAGELLVKVDAALARYEALVRRLRPEEFGGVREIGRKRLETTAVGLAIHIAEHGQRHSGQLVSAAKLSRARIA
jgi:DinB superfamily